MHQQPLESLLLLLTESRRIHFVNKENVLFILRLLNILLGRFLSSLSTFELFQTQISRANQEFHSANRSLRSSKMNPPTTCIDDLPPEMVCELFKYLHPKDLAACSRVNKRWHSIYSGFKVHRLFVSKTHDPRFCHWYHSKRTVEDQQLIRPEPFGRLAGWPLLSNLKHLALRDFPSEFNLNQLKSFGQLLHLEINTKTTEIFFNLKLPKLKVLSIVLDCPLLFIDCPELCVLHYDEPNNKNWLNVVHPETIRKLNTNMSGSKLVPFKNVDCLVTNRFNLICKDTLLSLPALKALHWNGVFEHLFMPISGRVRTLEEMKRRLNEFMDEANALRGDDFQLRFAGFQLTKQKLNEINFDMRVEHGQECVYSEYVYLKNYELIDSDDTLAFIDHDVNYTRLLEVTPEIPSYFFKRFARIQGVRTRGPVENAAHFLWFLRSLSPVSRLSLSRPKLNQEFYDQLPVVAPSLTYLDLDEEPFELNLQFICELSHFALLVIHKFLPLESLELILGCRIESGFFCFQTENARYMLETEIDSKSWVVSEYGSFDHPIFTSEEPAEIIAFFKGVSDRAKKQRV